METERQEAKMRRNQSQRAGEGGDGGERETKRGGEETQRDNPPLESGQARAPHPARPLASRPRGPGRTGPAWGCPHCHTSRTRGSADTHGRSGSGHSSGTEAPSARCRVTGVGGGVRALPSVGPAPMPRPHLSSQPRQPPCG